MPPPRPPPRSCPARSRPAPSGCHSLQAVPSRCPGNAPAMPRRGASSTMHHFSSLTDTREKDTVYHLLDGVDDGCRVKGAEVLAEVVEQVVVRRQVDVLRTALWVQALPQRELAVRDQAEVRRAGVDLERPHVVVELQTGERAWALVSLVTWSGCSRRPPSSPRETGRHTPRVQVSAALAPGGGGGPSCPLSYVVVAESLAGGTRHGPCTSTTLVP